MFQTTNQIFIIHNHYDYPTWESAHGCLLENEEEHENGSSKTDLQSHLGFNISCTISIYFNLFHTFSYIFSIFYFHYSSYMFIYTYSIIIILFHTVSNSSPLLCLPWHWALYLSQLPADLVHFWEENPQEWNVLNKWNWTKHNQTMSLQ